MLMLIRLISPFNFHFIALMFADRMKPCLLVALAFFIAFLGLQSLNLPSQSSLLVWLPTMTILSAIEFIIFAAFLAFFKHLHSHDAENETALKFYQLKEWLEVCLFTILLPLPLLIVTMIFIKTV